MLPISAKKQNTKNLPNALTKKEQMQKSQPKHSALQDHIFFGQVKTKRSMNPLSSIFKNLPTLGSAGYNVGGDSAKPRSPASISREDGLNALREMLDERWVKAVEDCETVIYK